VQNYALREFLNGSNAAVTCREVKDILPIQKNDRYLKDYIEVADTASVYDSSGEAPILVFTKNNGKMQIIKEPSDIPWVENYIYKYYKDADRVLILRTRKNRKGQGET